VVAVAFKKKSGKVSVMITPGVTRGSDDVVLWQISAVPTAPSNVGYRGYSGREMLAVRLSHFDPNRQSDHPPCGQERIQAGHAQSLASFGG